MLNFIILYRVREENNKHGYSFYPVTGQNMDDYSKACGQELSFIE